MPITSDGMRLDAELPPTITAPAKRTASAPVGLEARQGTAFATRGWPRDEAVFSDEALALARRGEPADPERSRREAPDAPTSPRGADGDPLTTEEQREVRALQARDREVRAHEQAHKAAAGELAAGAPSYEYETGPDGRDYAVGGEVRIQLRSGRTPEESVRLAQKARRAALAPAQPSAQDRSVAAQAAQMEAAARAEMRGVDEESEPTRVDAYREAAEAEPPAALPRLFG